MILPRTTPRPRKNLSDLNVEALEAYRAALIRDCEGLEKARTQERDRTDKELWRLKAKREAYSDALDEKIKEQEREIARLAAKKQAILSSGARSRLQAQPRARRGQTG